MGFWRGLPGFRSELFSIYQMTKCGWSDDERSWVNNAREGFRQSLIEEGVDIYLMRPIEEYLHWECEFREYLLEYMRKYLTHGGVPNSIGELERSALADIEVKFMRRMFVYYSGINVYRAIDRAKRAEFRNNRPM